MAYNIHSLIQNENVVPFMRVHVYQGDGKALPLSPGSAKPPVHWAGPNPPGGDKPTCIVGHQGLWVSENRGLPMEWEVLDGRVNQTRQWASSQAEFKIAKGFNAIELVDNAPIRPNDIIVIEIAYANGYDTKVTTESGQTNFFTPNNPKGTVIGDVVFFGIVHTVKLRLGSGEKDGMVYSIAAKDMMVLLTDNKIRGHYNPSKLDGYNRAFIIRDLIWMGAAIDYVQWKRENPDDVNSPYVYVDGFRVPEQDESHPDLVAPADFGANNCYLDIGSLEVSEREEVKIPDEGNQGGIVLMDKFPLDAIRHFSMVETDMRELWADQRNGRIHWMARRSDIRNLIKAPESRQYFYMYPPDRANIVSATMEWSTAGTVTHFTLSNPLAPIANDKKQMEIFAESPIAQLKDPHTGKYLRPMTRNRFVYDDTLFSEGDARLVVDSLFNIWGRAIETGMVMIPGDPTLEIGEGIQLFNTPLFGRRYHESRPETLKNDYAQANNPEGVHRVEAVTHLFMVGGVGNGYKTVFVFGPLDTDTGSARRLMKTDDDWSGVKRINIKDFEKRGFT